MINNTAIASGLITFILPCYRHTLQSRKGASHALKEEIPCIALADKALITFGPELIFVNNVWLLQSVCWLVCLFVI
jgi:hypothetical protein